MHRGLWLPRCRKKPFFPLCPCRTPGHTRPGNSARLPPSRHTAYAPSGITHTRSQHFASALQDFCSNSLRAAHFVVRAVYDTVVLDSRGSRIRTETRGVKLSGVPVKSAESTLSSFWSSCHGTALGTIVKLNLVRMLSQYSLRRSRYKHP